MAGGARAAEMIHHGDREALLKTAALHAYKSPDGEPMRFTWRTLGPVLA